MIAYLTNAMTRLPVRVHVIVCVCVCGGGGGGGGLNHCYMAKKMEWQK